MLEAQAAEEEARKQAEEEQRKKEVQLVLTITSRILRILMEHIEMKNSLDSKLQLLSICSVRILNILEVIAKTSFSKIAKCSTLPESGAREVSSSV